jgi:hypothetical protein
MAEFKPSVGHMSVADNWQIGDIGLKHLNDVTENEAPFVYLKGSHNPDMQWRERKEKEYYIYGKNHHMDIIVLKVDYIAKKYNYEKIVCNAKAGSIVMADTRGLHRGSVLRDNHRLVLVNFFDVRN